MSGQNKIALGLFIFLVILSAVIGITVYKTM